MRKNSIKFVILALALSIFTFVGCQSGSDEETFADGVINVNNNTGKTIYVQLCAINQNL